MSAPVAIVGVGCRFPGANGRDAYWRLLCDGVDAISEVPPDRWDADALYDPDPTTPGKMSTRWGGFLDDVEGFDADFFRISAREAARMDPQQRLALEVAWEALEDAGIAPKDLAGSSTGVFMGVSTYDHGVALGRTTVEPEPYDGTGSALSIVANRLSYALDLRGPSLVVDTACSSSLVSVHTACQALRGGEADLALAGGVNVVTSPSIAYSFSKGGLMAGDGRCKPFDSRADGYVRSEGAGVVVLKPLEAAVADGDRVYAVLLGGAVNQDGRTNGLTAPNRLAQEAALRAAYRAADVDPADVSYVEAHGTGTAVGDPIEVGALGRVLCAGRPADRPLRVGSVKSNVGHLEAAAGVAGLIKAALALHHGELPRTLHFREPNPMLGLDRLPVAVQSEHEPWPHAGGRAIAGVSSFGFGGTNAHVVVEAAPPPAARPAPRPGDARLVPLSARTDAALRRRAAAWERAAREHEDDPGWLGGAAAAAALRGNHYEQRAAVVAADAGELAEGAAALHAGEPGRWLCGPRTARRRPPRTAFVFPGQGSQWAGMGRRLAASDATFRAAIRRCDAALARWLGRSLWSDDAGLVADGTSHVQPAVFAIQVALAETWRAWGITPAAVVGHSMGEIAAAHVSGALSLEDAARIACERSRLLEEISGRGGLALVELDADEARELVAGRGDVSIAAANGPRATVLTGAPDALDAVLAPLDERGVFARRIAVEFAAHSPEVEPLQPRLRAAIEGIVPMREAVAMYSTVTAAPIAGTELGPSYWEANLRETVLFAPTVDRLLADGHDAIVEIAPHPVLARSIAEIATAGGRDTAVVASLRRDEDELRAMLHGLGELYTGGAAVDWRALHPGGAPHVEQPPHGWDRQRFPTPRGDVVPAAGAARPSGPDGRAPADGLGPPVVVVDDPDLRLWMLGLDLERAPELAEHVVGETPLVPGAYWLTAAAEAAGAAADAGAVVLEDVEFRSPRTLGGDDAGELQLALRGAPGAAMRFTIGSAASGGRPVAHATGAVRAAVPAEAPAAVPPEELRSRCPAPADPADLYGRLEQAGLRYGPRFRGLAELRVGADEAVARVTLHEALDHEPPVLHPALLDACLHTAAAAIGAADAADGALPLPAGVGRVWARRDGEPLRDGWCHARVAGGGADDVVVDVTVFDGGGVPVWAASGLRIRFVRARRRPEEGALYELAWSPVELDAPAAAGGAWVLLDGAAGVGRALAERLEAHGETCTVVVPGAPVPPLDADSLRGVVDARAVGATGTELDETALLHSADAVLGLLRTLAAQAQRDGAPRVWLVSSGAEGPGGGADAGALAGAASWGLGRVAANELPGLPCSLADLDPRLTPADLDALAAALVAGEPPGQLAVRDGAVTSPALVPLTAAPGAAAVPIRGDRTYLVTGGLGAIGLQVAGRLVARGARHLLLVGRSAPSAQAAQAVERLRGAGAAVDVARADVADPAALAAVLEGLGAGRPALGGVFHAAGVLEDATVPELGEEQLHRALAGKAVGAWNLHRLTREQPLELFVVLSSLAGLVGSPGQGAYAAANSVLDALARHRAALGLPAMSVAFGPWAGAGLAVEAGGVDRLAAAGVPPLEPAIGTELLEAAMATGRTHVTAAAFRFDDLRLALAGPAARQLLGGLVPRAEVARGHARDAILAAAGEADRRHAMRAFLTEQVAGVLRLPPAEIDPTVPFEELGFDSLMAIELRDRLEVALDTRLSATLSFSHPTAEALAEALLERLAPPVEEPAAAVAPQPAPAAEEDLDDLDEDQLAALVEQELDALGGVER